MKKLFIVAATMVMMATCVLAATATVNGITWTYTVRVGKASISGIPRATTGAITIPMLLGGYRVTSIGNGAFSGCSGLTSVTILSTVTSIGNGAFSGCSGLTSVAISNSVTSIGSSAFSGCSGLTKFIVDSNNSTYKSVNGLLLTKDGKTLIAGINGNVVIPDSVTSIGERAFSGYSGLTSVTIGNSVTSIGEGAFYGCSGLTSVTIGNSVTSIGDSAFDGCGSLTDITIPDSVTSIGDYVFNYCWSLTFISFLGLPPEIGASDFSTVNPEAIGNYPSEYHQEWLSEIDSNGKWNGLKMDPLVYSYNDTTMEATVIGYSGGEEVITIPSEVERSNYNELFHHYITETYKVTSIGENAFYGCSGLTSVTIPDSITSIGENAFKDCNGLKEVHIGYDVGTWCGIKFANPHSNPLSYGGSLYLDSIPFPTSPIEKLYIPKSVTSIGDYAFYNCSGLTSVEISNSATSIGIEVFEGCNSIEKVMVCQSICDKKMQDVFPSYKSIKSVSIAYGVTSIGSEAFSGCSSLTDITIPDSVTSIGENEFKDCKGLKKVYITNINAWCSILFHNAYSNPLWNGGDLYEINGEVVDLVEHLETDGTTSINNFAFYGCNSLRWLGVGSSGIELSIGQEAFAFCDNLERAVLPNNVTKISKWAFSRCLKLSEVYINNSSTSVDIPVFDGCNSIKKVMVCQSICDKKMQDVFPSYKSIESVSIAYGVTSIGSEAFSGCSSLTDITIPDSVTSIGNSAFDECESLKSAVIGSGVKNIGVAAFGYCKELKSIQVSPSNRDYKSENKMLLSKDGKTLIEGVNGSVFVPKTVTTIGDSAFMGRCNLTHFINLYNKVEKIGNNAFFCCENLKKIDIPDSVTSIGNLAFYKCSDLTSVMIGKRVKSIGDGAFYKCSSLTLVLFYGDAPEMGFNIFEDCHKDLKIVFYQNKDGWDKYLDSTVSSSIFGTNYSLLEKASVNEEDGPIIMTEMVDGIEWKYFVNDGKAEIYGGNGWTSAISSNTMGSITIPSQLSDYPVISIHNSAFLDCVGLTNITIPNSVTNIGFAAFSGCSGLTSVTIPDSVMSIGEYAFRSCSGLTSVTIPDSVTSIGEWAFSWCYDLKSAIFLGDAPRDVGGYPFDGCADDFVIKVKRGTKGWNGDPNSTELPETWYGYPIEYDSVDDLYPELDANATAEDVANALSGSVDENLAKNITSVEMYSVYREWALSVKNASGDEVAGAEAVKASSNAWLSFALDSDVLIAKAPVDGDVVIDSFEKDSSSGLFEFTVNIKDIGVGGDAIEENLRKVFDIEGTSNLSADFSADSVDISVVAPDNGKVKFSVAPIDKSKRSFFFRVKMK